MVFKKLLDLLSKKDKILIQTHNFPDPDAVASAFGLYTILSSEGFFAQMVYDGEVRRTALQRMIESLSIPIKPRTECSFSLSDKVIIVDGCKGNSNITPLPGEVIGVIDHHTTGKPPELPFADIRPDLGSCSTLVYLYFKEMNVPVPPFAATALMIGINIDTAHLTRETTSQDIQAYAELFHFADMAVVNSIIRNNSQITDLKFYRYAFENVSLKGKLAFCFFPEGCEQNLLGILADFFLGIDEIDFVAIAARNFLKIDISLRSGDPDYSCSEILFQVLSEYGSSGGHREMAGGSLYLEKFPQNQEPEKFLKERFAAALEA